MRTQTFNYSPFKNGNAERFYQYFWDFYFFFFKEKHTVEPICLLKGKGGLLSPLSKIMPRAKACSPRF